MNSKLHLLQQPPAAVDGLSFYKTRHHGLMYVACFWQGWRTPCSSTPHGCLPDHCAWHSGIIFRFRNILFGMGQQLPYSTYCCAHPCVLESQDKDQTRLASPSVDVWYRHLHRLWVVVLHACPPRIFLPIACNEVRGSTCKWFCTAYEAR